MNSQTTDNAAARKKIVEEYFGSLMDPNSALKFFAPNCRQYNPYVKGGMDALMKSMAEAQVSMGPQFPDPDFVVKTILVDGDMAAAHTELLAQKSKPSEGGMRQVHLFRFGPDNKITEYWDITQMITKDQPNTANAF